MLRINFVDFWPNFNKTDNYFFHLLKTKYRVEINENDPDLVFFSVDYAKRNELSRYNNHICRKVFFTGENVSPNFDSQEPIQYPRYSIGKADIAFSFDYSDDVRNYRFPLWAFYTNWFDVAPNINRDPSHLVPLPAIYNTASYRYQRKDRFCNFLFSNTSGERINILDTIEQYKSVVCPGSLRNNTDERVEGRGDQKQKLNFISSFKFTIAAENSQSDGYTTEKMIHPLSVRSFPIYWGANRVTEEFNEKAFINANKLSGQDLLDRVIEIDQNDALYLEMVNEPRFPNDKIPSNVLPQNVLKFIEETVLC